jgi:hypothetical protein
MLFRSPLTFNCVNQSVVALSRTTAEYIATIDGLLEAE